MKICHIITTISRGGAENQLLILVRHQVLQGNEVVVYPLKNKLELLEDFLSCGASVNLSLHNKNFISQVSSINFRGKLNFDIIHCHLPQAELLLALSTKRNIVISRHYGGPFFPGRAAKLSNFLSRLASRRAFAVIAISKSVKNYLRASGEVKRSTSIPVVEYGFDASSFSGILEKKSYQHLCPNEKIVFGTLARLSTEKDLKTLITAAEMICTRRQSSNRVRIFGEGPLKAELQELIDNLGVESKVELLGRTMSPELELSKLDVFVLTSVYEGFGMVLLEAMSLGLPIICSRIPTTIEVMGDSGAAVYFQPGDEVDLADKMRNINQLVEPNYLKEQEKRLDEYSVNEMYSKLNEVYVKYLQKYNL